MSEPSIIFDEVNERQGVFNRRVFLLGGATFAGVGVLTGRLAQLQLLQNKGYRELAKQNQFNMDLIIPPRGLVVDRNGVALASNRPNFRVMLTPDKVPDVDSALTAVCQVLGLDDKKLASLKKDVSQSSSYRPVLIADDLTWEQFSAVNLCMPELPGVTAAMGEARVYPYGGAFAHVIGYVAKVSAKDLEETATARDDFSLHPSFRIGKQGIEKALEKQLRGRPGFEMSEVDANGRVIGRRPDEDIPPTPGDEVVLTIDADIQNRAMEVLGAESGAAVMMDCRTGDILCLASSPSFDANSFVTGISGPEYRALSSYDRKPLFNKALTATYPPGSTFKMTVALAALEEGIPPETTHTCTGAWRYGNRTFHCDAVHGTIDMRTAIKVSCDVFFYESAVAIGINKVAETARKLGYGQLFDIGIPNQKSGIVPDEAWKKEYYKTRNPSNTRWFPGETPSVGIGQGALAVNPLQQCVMIARMANAKKALTPRLIRSIGGVEQPAGSEVPDLPFTAEHMEVVRSAMASVANEAGGTAFNAAQLDMGPIKMAGKTGTAQAYSYGSGSRATAHLEWLARDHAWFVAFAPYDDPRYALCVLIEHGGWGASAAAPRAREIMRTALMKDPEVLERIRNPASFVDTNHIAADAAMTGDALAPDSEGPATADPTVPPEIVTDTASQAIVPPPPPVIPQ